MNHYSENCTLSVSSFVMSGSASLSGSDHIAVFLPSPIHTYRSNPFLTSCISARLLTTLRSGLTFRGRFDLCRWSSVLLVRCYRRCWCLDNSMIHNDMTVPKMAAHHRMVPYRKRGGEQQLWPRQHRSSIFGFSCSARLCRLHDEYALNEFINKLGRDTGMPRGRLLGVSKFVILS